MPEPKARPRAQKEVVEAAKKKLAKKQDGPIELPDTGTPGPGESSPRAEQSGRLRAVDDAERESMKRRISDYQAAHPGSPLPADLASRYRALRPEMASASDADIASERAMNRQASEAIDNDPAKYEEFLSRRAFPAPPDGDPNSVRTSPDGHKWLGGRDEQRGNFKSRRDVVDARLNEKIALDDAEARGVPTQWLSGTKAEQLKDAHDARMSAMEKAKAEGRDITEDGPAPTAREKVDAALARLRDGRRDDTVFMDGMKSAMDQPNASPALAAGARAVAGQPSKAEEGLEAIKAAARLARKKLGGR